MSEEISEESLKDEASTQVLYEQLQSEYNKLLKQYAAAENTIDELRTGATVHLYTEPLESRPNSRLSFETARYPQSINFPRPLQASTSEFSTMNETCSTFGTTGGRVETPIQGDNSSGKRSLQDRIQTLKEDVNAVESILSESGVNNEETLNELLGICAQLHKEYGTIVRELKLQSRNTVGLSSSNGNNFSTKTELQRELYRIGLRIEEIQGDIMARLKAKKPTAVKSGKLPNDEKATLSPDLESLVKEMKDLKDASIKNSEEVLNRMENTRTGKVLPNGRYSESKHGVMDSRYFTASPVNKECPASFESEGSENEQTLNMTWPPSRTAAEPDILRRSFSETTQGYDQSSPDEIKTRRSGHSRTNHSMSNDQSLQNNNQPRTEDNSKASYYSRKEQPKQINSDENRSERRDSFNIRKHTPYSEDETVWSEQHRLDPAERHRTDPSQQHRSDPSQQHRSDPSQQHRSDHSEQHRSDPSDQPRSDHSKRHRSDPSEQHRLDPSERRRGDGLNPGNVKHTPFSSQETVVYKSDSSRPDRQENKHHPDTRKHSLYSDDEHEKEKRLSKHSDCERKDYPNLKNAKNYPVYSDEEPAQHEDKQSQFFKHTEKQSPEHFPRSPDLSTRNFNSMSSLADSSRMSTPLFQPRGATRVSPHSTRGPHAPRHKERSPSDGFDSGFVGSEASRSSRLTTDRPDGVKKLNISSQWDSSLHLDLVSEIDENESTGEEQMSTTYELNAEDGRQSPTKGTKSRQLSEDVKFINCSPPSSPGISPRKPAEYFEYRAPHSRLPGNGGNSLPVHNTDDPLLSHINERPLMEHRPSPRRDFNVDETSTTSMDRRKLRRAGSRDVSSEVTADIRTSGDTVRPPRKADEHNTERKLQVLRNELDSLHDHVNTLQRSRVTMDMYDEFRDRDEHLRRGYERRHERKLEELRESIDQLKRNIKSRNRNDRRRPDRGSEFYDDFRNELRKVTDRLDELTALRDTSETSPAIHLSPSESFSTHYFSHDEDMTRRFRNLVKKVDELRLRIENPRDNFDAPRETSGHFCRLCYEADVYRHGNWTENAAGHQPKTSTPFVSDVHHGRESTAKVEDRSTSTRPGAILQETPVVHHIHTYHKGLGLKQHYETDSEDDVKRTPRRKNGIHRSRYRSRHDLSYIDHLSLDDARKAAWDVQRLSKNILNSISLDLTSLKS